MGAPMKKQILIVAVAALTAVVVILSGTSAATAHSIKPRASLLPRSRCRCCSRPPKSQSGSALVRNAPWTRRDVPCIRIRVSPPTATKPALLDLRRGQPAHSGRPRQLLIGRKGLQESNQVYSALRRCQSAVGLHVVAGHCLVGVCDEAFEVFLVPNEVCAFHSAGIRIAW